MTTSDKTKRNPKKIILWITLSLAAVALLTLGGIYGFRLCVACSIQNYYIQAANVSRFEDFSSIQDDFETVAKLVFEHKSRILNCEPPCLLLGEVSDTFYAGTYDFDIELTEAEKESVVNVYNAYRNEGVSAYLDMISFLGDDDEELLFWSEIGQYAIVYAPDDDPHSDELEQKMGKKAGIVKLADCWYQVVRP